jgi:hypothetical protein
MRQDEAPEQVTDDAGGMSLREWETFRIRAAALEQAVAWVSVWDASSTSDVLEVAEEFEAFLRGENSNGTES